MTNPEDIIHEEWCTVYTDDESDYEWLADAGECCCGGAERRKITSSEDLRKAIAELSQKMRPKQPNVFVYDKPLKPRYWKR